MTSSFVTADHMARQASEEIASVGEKCLRATVPFPDPLGPMRTTRERLGILMCITWKL
jgi:hypothetical protein